MITNRKYAGQIIGLIAGAFIGALILVACSPRTAGADDPHTNAPRTYWGDGVGVYEDTVRNVACYFNPYASRGDGNLSCVFLGPKK